SSPPSGNCATNAPTSPSSSPTRSAPPSSPGSAVANAASATLVTPAPSCSPTPSPSPSAPTDARSSVPSSTPITLSPTRPAGPPPPGARAGLSTPPADEAAADRVWDIAGLGASSEVVRLNPGAAFGAAKHWPSEHFSRLADDLVEKHNCAVLVLCGPSER